MSCYEIPWFSQDFKSENLCFLNIYSVHAGARMDLPLEIVLSPPKRGMKHAYNSKDFSFMLERYNISFF